MTSKVAKVINGHYMEITKNYGPRSYIMKERPDDKRIIRGEKVA